jgi:hypothetical protein
MYHPQQMYRCFPKSQTCRYFLMTPKMLTYLMCRFRPKFRCYHLHLPSHLTPMMQTCRYYHLFLTCRYLLKSPKYHLRLTCRCCHLMRKFLTCLNLLKSRCCRPFLTCHFLLMSRYSPKSLTCLPYLPCRCFRVYPMYLTCR